MKERAKSVLLCLLVLCSLLLTYQLWFGRQPVEITAESDFEPVYFDETRPLSQMIYPQRIYIFREDQCYQVRRGERTFDLLWEELSGMLQDMGEPENYYDRDGPPGDADLLFSVQFEPLLPLGPESIWLKSRGGGKLAGIEIWRWEERYWAGLDEEGHAAPLLLLPPGWAGRLATLHGRYKPQRAQLCEQLPVGELRPGRHGAVQIDVPLYVPVGISTLGKLTLKEERLDGESLLKTFFINRNLVREIKEKDGGLIYTDGEQGLRLGRGLDYSHPQPEQRSGESSYPAVLLKAGKLLGYHGGWPGNLYLESLDQQAQGKDSAGALYRVRWRSYFGGFPLLGDSGVEMDYHLGLQSYRRDLYVLPGQPGGKVKVKNYREALRAALDLLQKTGEEQPVLEGLELAYYLAGAEAVPVWVARLSGREILLKTDELVPPEGWEP